MRIIIFDEEYTAVILMKGLNYSTDHDIITVTCSEPLRSPQVAWLKQRGATVYDENSTIRFRHGLFRGKMEYAEIKIMTEPKATEK